MQWGIQKLEHTPYCYIVCMYYWYMPRLNAFIAIISPKQQRLSRNSPILTGTPFFASMHRRVHASRQILDADNFYDHVALFQSICDHFLQTTTNTCIANTLANLTLINTSKCNNPRLVILIIWWTIVVAKIVRPLRKQLTVAILIF